MARLSNIQKYRKKIIIEVNGGMEINNIINIIEANNIIYLNDKINIKLNCNL